MSSKCEYWRHLTHNGAETHGCIGRRYKQGMNEIIAPFIWLTPPPCGTLVPFRLFEGFLFRYLERYFCTDDHLHLHVAFKLFHLLLLFHDPQLAKQLQVCLAMSRL